MVLGRYCCACYAVKEQELGPRFHGGGLKGRRQAGVCDPHRVKRRVGAARNLLLQRTRLSQQAVGHPSGSSDKINLPIITPIPYLPPSVNNSRANAVTVR